MEALNESIRLNKVAENALVYRPAIKPSKSPHGSASDRSIRILYRFWNLDSIEYVEQVHIVLLNSGNWVLGICSINTGP